MGFMDSTFEFKITFKNKKAILQFIILHLYTFFVVPIQLFIFYFKGNFGKSKIYQKVSSVKIVELTLFSIFWAVVFSFLVYIVELAVGVEEDGIILLPGLTAILIMLYALIRLSWVVVVQSMEVLVTFILSLVKTILALTMEKVYK